MQLHSTLTESPKILIVDDAAVNVRLLEGILQPEGFVTVVAREGATARAMSRTERPDLILLDVIMPGETGFETCSQLKSDPLIAAADQLSETQQWVVIVFERAGRPMGLLAAEPLDMIETHVELDTITLRQPGIAGSAILDSQTTLMLDIFELASSLGGTVLPVAGSAHQEAEQIRHLERAGETTILIAEDSDFFRGQIRRMVEAAGYRVMAAADGQAAWELLDQHAAEISLVATDIVMPRLDGLGLTRLIRADGRFDALPIIALARRGPGAKPAAHMCHRRERGERPRDGPAGLGVHRTGRAADEAGTWRGGGDHDQADR